MLPQAPKLLPKEVLLTPPHATKMSVGEKGLCPTQDGTPECCQPPAYAKLCPPPPHPPPFPGPQGLGSGCPEPFSISR